MLESGLVLTVAPIMTAMVMQQRILEQKVSDCYRRMEQPSGADGGEVRPKKGRKSVLRHSPVMSEAYTILASS